MRRKIYQIIETSENNSTVSRVYDLVMMITIILSVTSLAFRSSNNLFRFIEHISVTIFIIDYILRLITADFFLHKSKLSFLIYPFTPTALIDIFSVLPFFIVISGGAKAFELFKLLRTLKLLRLLKFCRYSKSLSVVVAVLKRQKRLLYAIATVAVGYILISALIIYNVEPEKFVTFFDAVYWAVITLTTVGYGDIYPCTTIGKVVTMVSSLIGIAFVALPSSVITAGYLAEMRHKK